MGKLRVYVASVTIFAIAHPIVAFMAGTAYRPIDIVPFVVIVGFYLVLSGHE